MMRRDVAGRLPLLATGAVLAGCALVRPGAGGRMAQFAAASGATEVARLQASAAQADKSGCVVTARFEGVARPWSDHLEVVISSGWIALTRDNNKEMDDLHLGIGTSRSAVDASASTMVLAPTVDTAGPSVTTWEAHDPLVVMLPWPAERKVERLHFFVTYQALGYDGRYIHCENALTTDTLRFASR